MGKNTFFTFCLLFACCQIYSQEARLISSNPQAIELKYTTPDYISAKKVSEGILYEDFSAVAKIMMMVKDAPSLPVFTESVIIPDTGDFSLEISYDNYIEIDDVLVSPSKGSLKRNVNPADVPYKFGGEYLQDSFFPGHLAKAGSPYIFRKTRGVTISFYPYQYNPVTKKLRIYKNISVRIVANQEAGQNARQAAPITSETAVFSSIYQNHYANTPSNLPVQGRDEMLIIAPEDYVPVLTSFKNWKIEEGIETTLVTLEDTGSDAVSIKNYISDFYESHPNLVYVQLVGDSQQLPTYSYGNPSGEELWSDTYYGQLLGTDFYPEVLVGRFSGTMLQVATMVERTLEYEIDPLEGNWMRNAIGIGSNEGDGYGDDGEADWQHLRNIGDQLTNFGFNTIYEFYDGSHQINDAEDSPTSEMIQDAINQGTGLVNYTGHGGWDVMSTGDFRISDVNTLANPGKYPFVISVACNNGTFVAETSLCESLLNVRYLSSPAGAIASCGSSILMAWAEPMQTQDEMTELIVRSDAQNIQTTLGGLFYGGEISMLEAYDQSTTAENVMQTWVFFGDPSTLFRSQSTTTIAGNHEEEISQSGGTLNIWASVTDSKVSITQNNNIIATSDIVDGIATIEIPALTSMSDLSVTITKENTVPYRGSVMITTALGVNSVKNLFAIYPNPASEQVFIESAGTILSDATIQLTDINGRVLILEKNINLMDVYLLDTSFLAPSVYLLSVTSENKNETKKIMIR